jgi:hypothetical protein
MTAVASLCRGTVVHKRLTPRRHALSYRVFSILIDVDEIAGVAARTRFFSYNRAGLISIHDRDHFAGDGEPIAVAVRRVLATAGYAASGVRIHMLTYPRVLGYVFNPLTVYVCENPDATVGAFVYEVSNTFGERTCYVVPAGAPRDGIHAHSCGKRMDVSPFAGHTGAYGFRVRLDADDVLIGVTLRDATGPVLKTHFRAASEPLTARAIVRALARMPAMTLKVIAAIHFEAARLWLKRVPLHRRRPGPAFAIRGTTTEKADAA